MVSNESLVEKVVNLRRKNNQLRVEIERLQEENRDLRDGFGVDEWWQLEKAEATIQRVRDLHVPDPDSDLLWCEADDRDWPCDTIRALDGETNE